MTVVLAVLALLVLLVDEVDAPLQLMVAVLAITLPTGRPAFTHT